MAAIGDLMDLMVFLILCNTAYFSDVLEELLGRYGFPTLKTKVWKFTKFAFVFIRIILCSQLKNVVSSTVQAERESE